MVFEVLNRLKWEQGMKGVEVVILHRGAPNNRKVISGEAVQEVKRGYFTYQLMSRDWRMAPGGETRIPMHRIFEVWKDGRILWKRP